jgi:hypothetical protein
MLIALGRGDKYRLTHIRESLEIGKELYISDQEFLQNLVKTHLKDRIYQARTVSISDKPDLFCENCGSTISADEKFCTNCGTPKPEPSQPPSVDVPEFAPEPETKQDARLGKKQASEGFAFTTDGDIGESATVETARDNLTKKIPELEEYEKKHFIESETNVTWEAYDVRAKKKVKIQNPRAVKMKNGKWAVKGTSPITGVKVCRFVGNKKPTISAEKTVESQKAESTAPAKKTVESPKKPAAPAKKIAESPKVEKEVVSRYYKSHEQDSPKVEKPKSKKPNPFCEECGSKISADEMFCTGCGTKR